MAVPVPPAPKLTPHLAAHQVILRPLLTEKGVHRATRHNAYSFQISTAAAKADVRRAVEELFNVKVVRVNTSNRKGKPRRTKFRRGHTKAWKKAVVKLHPEDKISFF